MAYKRTSPQPVEEGGTGASTLTDHAVIIGSGTGAVSLVGPVSSTGALLASNGVGSDPGFTTATYPLTTTANELLYSSSTNTVGGLATGNDGVLITSGAGVPSISSTLPSTVQGNITSVGTIASGTWNGTDIAVADGGTGLSSTTAYAVICGGTTSTASLQSIAGVGTAAQVLTSNGVGALPTFQDAVGGTTSVAIQVFTSNGTYTPTAGMAYCIIECAGGGGGSGGITSSTSGYYVSSGAGGGGGYSRSVSTAAAIGASQTVTIGAAGAAGSAGTNNGGNGGDTSVGSICIAKGGIGGTGSPGNTGVNGGAGGIAGTGDLTFPGGAGLPGLFLLASSGPIGTALGGSCHLGFGGASIFTSVSNTTGTAGSVYGGGGAGSISYSSGGNVAGAAGAAGVVIITEYIES